MPSLNEKMAWLTSRRSIRRYLPTPVPTEWIETLLTAAIWAPSAHNRQPWRFVVMTETAVKIRLATAMGEKLRADLLADNQPETFIAKEVGRSYDRLTNAPVLILLCLSMVDMDSYPDPVRQQNERLMAVQSCAMAGQNLLLAAHALGLGACWLCAPLFCPEVVQQTLALPLDWEGQSLITVGFPAEEKQKERWALNGRVRYL